MFGSCGFFEVGQQECDYAEQRHVGTDMIAVSYTHLTLPTKLEV